MIKYGMNQNYPSSPYIHKMLELAIRRDRENNETGLIPI